MTTQNENTNGNNSSKNPAQNLTQEGNKGVQHPHQGESNPKNDQKSAHTLTEEERKKSGEHHPQGNKS